MPNYLLILSGCFPGAEAYTAGDPTVYEDLIWETTPIAKATLDASDCAINGPSVTSIPDPIIPNGGIPDGSHIQWNDTLGEFEFVIPAAGANSIGTISGDTGSAVADSIGDTMTIAGDGGKISTVASDTTDTITVSFAGLDVDELLDVDATTNAPLADNYSLRYDTASSKWIATPDTSPPPSGGANFVQLFWGPIQAISGTASIPKDTSLPLVTEGAEVWTQTITPTSTTSSIRIAVNATFSSSNASIELVFAIFRDDVCVGTAVNTTANKSSGFAVSFEIYDEPNTDVEVTYACRCGRTGANGTWYINDIDSTTGAFAGTLAQNSYSVEEIGVV